DRDSSSSMEAPLEPLLASSSRSPVRSPRSRPALDKLPSRLDLGKLLSHLGLDKLLCSSSILAFPCSRKQPECLSSSSSSPPCYRTNTPVCPAQVVLRPSRVLLRCPLFRLSSNSSSSSSSS